MQLRAFNEHWWAGFGHELRGRSLGWGVGRGGTAATPNAPNTAA
jgi:hypothetical protein